MGKFKLKRSPRPPRPPRVKNPLKGVNRARMRLVTVFAGFIAFGMGFFFIYKNIVRMVPGSSGKKRKTAQTRVHNEAGTEPGRTSTNVSEESRAGSAQNKGTKEGSASATGETAGTAGRTRTGEASGSHGNGTTEATSSASAGGGNGGVAPHGATASYGVSGPLGSHPMIPQSSRVNINVTGPICYRLKEGVKCLQHPDKKRRNEGYNLFIEALDYEETSREDEVEMQCLATIKTSYLGNR